ncbi:MAG: mycoredoxin [Verrucomicrobiales bacterium]|jgi:mycoredoxin
MKLRAGLQASGIPLTKHNIWAAPADAALVRSIAGGNETVPTLLIGPVALVNPTVRHVRHTIKEHAPHLLR